MALDHVMDCRPWRLSYFSFSVDPMVWIDMLWLALAGREEGSGRGGGRVDWACVVAMVWSRPKKVVHVTLFAQAYSLPLLVHG